MTQTQNNIKKNEKTAKYRKVYVEVYAFHSLDGKTKPISIRYENSAIYEIDRVLTSCRAAATKVGGCGMRYTVKIGARETYLFEDEGKWFVESRS